MVARLIAEADPVAAPALVYPPDLVARAPDAAQTEQELFRARVMQFRETLVILEEILSARSAELALLEPVRDVADTLIDTTELSPHDLRDTLQDRFDVSAGAGLAVSLHSFSYKRGLPQGADMVFDCRFLTNPHWDPALRHMTGLDSEVVDYIAKDGRFDEFRTRVVEMLKFLLPAYRDEGKAHFSVAFGCTGGQHRSVAIAETCAVALAKAGWQVSIRHRELKARMSDESKV